MLAIVLESRKSAGVSSLKPTADCVIFNSAKVERERRQRLPITIDHVEGIIDVHSTLDGSSSRKFGRR